MEGVLIHQASSLCGWLQDPFYKTSICRFTVTICGGQLCFLGLTDLRFVPIFRAQARALSQGSTGNGSDPPRAFATLEDRGRAGAEGARCSRPVKVPAGSQGGRTRLAGLSRAEPRGTGDLHSQPRQRRRRSTHRPPQQT